MPQTNFSLNIAAFAEKAKGRMDLVLQKVSADVLTSLVLKSPVDTGAFRNAWVVNNEQFVYVPGSKPPDKSGNAAIQAGLLTIQKINAGQTVTITNGLPYGPRLESGWSKQAPSGFVRLTIIEFNDFIRKAVGGTR